MATSSGDIERGGLKNRANNNNNNYPPPPTYYRDDDSDDEQWTSWLIPLIVVINVAVFVLIMFINNCPKHHRNDTTSGGKCVARFLGRFSFEPLHQNPLFGPSSSTLDKLGGLHWYNIVHKHQGWRLLTSMWLHAGVIHLLINMLSLVFIGIRLEQQFGFVKIGIIYLVSGFGGGVLSSLFIQKSISVGASGALFGLLGAMLAELVTNWTIYSNKVAALVTLTVIILINLAIGILPFADNFAHIGGFFTGLLMGFVLLPRPRMGWLTAGNIPSSVRVRSKYKAYQLALWVISLILLIVGMTVALVMLFKGDNGHRHCHWCRYLNCVPTSKWHCDV